MKILSLKLSALICYLAIPLCIYQGLALLSSDLLLGLGCLIGGAMMNLALATVFSHVLEQLKAQEALQKETKDDKPLSDISGTPWEKKA